MTAALATPGKGESLELAIVARPGTLDRNRITTDPIPASTDGDPR